jgi:hypothetical protein
MKSDILNFLLSKNFLILSSVLIEVIVRIIPTKQNFSTIDILKDVIDKVIPNRKKDGL